MKFKSRLVRSPTFKGSIADHHALRYVEKTCFPFDDIDSLAGWWWLLETTLGDLAGYFGMAHYYDDRMFLSGAGVMPAYRGQGLQRRMLTVREAKARRMGYTRTVTYTSSWNPASINSLTRCGYKAYRPATGLRSKTPGHDWLSWYKDLQ